MAQAILLQDVENVGERGDVIDVSSGYLRNFLLPRKLAQPATPGALAEAKRRMEAGRAGRPRGRRTARRRTRRCCRKTVLTIPQAAGETAACSARSPRRTSSTRSSRRAA